MKKIIIVLGTVGMFGSFALGAEQKGMSLEQREKMAGIHEKMATCLRTDRPILECREEMMKSCKAAMGKTACPMMEGNMKPGMHHLMMNDDEAAK